MANLSQPNNPHYNTAEDHLSRLLADSVEEPWYKLLAATIGEIIHPPKLPPLEVTSKPVAVKDIWGLYGRQKKSFMMSTGFQIAMVVLVFTVFSTKPGQQAVKAAVSIVMPSMDPDTPFKPDKVAPKGGGGGGDRSLLEASKGKLPKQAYRQFTPPSAVVNNDHPLLSMEPSILADPSIKLPDCPTCTNYGDPLGKIGPPSNGTGSGGGIGSGKGGGVGSGNGGGMGPGSGGGFGGGAYKVGNGVTAPIPIYKPEPEYSEEARKAKYSGEVILAVIIDAKGLPTNISVVHSLGLGLDEQAIKAVQQWRFKPGTKDGKPVAVQAQIAVNFRLL
jgi:periplasmic protein TonB